MRAADGEKQKGGIFLTRALWACSRRAARVGFWTLELQWAVCARPVSAFPAMSWSESSAVNSGNRRYSIYSIKDGGERRARGISELGGQESTPWTHKSCIFKRGLISQAGRRGFEPRLPLQTPFQICALSAVSSLAEILVTPLDASRGSYLRKGV